MPFHLELALDNGVTPAEVSELITHLAFYTGWGNAMSAIPVARAVFKARNLGEHGITSDIELIAIQDINAAYERMLKSDVKYRFVIDQHA